MSRRIAIIGGGQLGSRHLQALARLPESTHITVVDPLKESLETCKLRVAEIAGWDRHSYEFLHDTEGLRDHDLAIVATSADVRREVTEALLSTTSVPALLLEKVLFQRAIDCSEVAALLRSKGVRAWVNAPRRMWPFYQWLRRALQGERILSLRQVGSGWGLACNAFHFLDLFTFLSGSGIGRISPDFLDRKPLEAKRCGFKELTGTLVGSLEDGGFFSISDCHGHPAPGALLIETERRSLRIAETAKTMTVLSGPGWTEQPDPEPMRQSDLTHLFVESVFSGDPVQLTEYEEASLVHTKMLCCFASVFASDGAREMALCPIT